MEKHVIAVIYPLFAANIHLAVAAKRHTFMIVQIKNQTANVK